MAVPVVNLVLDKGTSFQESFTVTNSDGSVYSLTNYSAAARIRKHPTATDYKSFQTSITVATGEIQISMASSITAQVNPGRNYYDVVITNSVTNKVTKVFEGTIMVRDTISV